MKNEQPVKKKNGIPTWIVEHLLKYGNCSINDDIYYLPEIERQCGFKVLKRKCQVCDSGYVLEKVKE